jgi:hypothetical protein
MFKLLKRLWIPLVISAVVAVGGFAVVRLHGMFGSEKSIAYSDTKQEETKPSNPKRMRYEVFGTPGAIAQISYFDVNGNPVHDDDVTLPWSLEFPISAAAGIGSVAAQSNGNYIGCRILIDHEIKAEKEAHHEVSTFASCILKAA